jgi:hypothetical protein
VIPLDLSALGLMTNLRPEDMILDAVVLMRVQKADESEPSLVITPTPGTDAIVTMGLVHTAARVLNWEPAS